MRHDRLGDATLKGKTLQLIVHKGTSEIGGTCIELYENGSRILLDLGMPLKEGSEPVDVRDLKPDAVLVSHSHQDHYGLLEDLDEGIPVYISELSMDLINATRVFRHLQTLKKNFRFFGPWVPFEVSPFTVTPYLVDHSAPNSFAFLVEAGGARLFYSGDFRAHGRKGVLFERLIQEPLSDIDVLLMEGTMLQRSDGGFPDESAVEEVMVETLERGRNASFLVCSSQNIDRIVSAFRACKRTGKTLVVDVYTAWVLEQMKLVSESVPNMFWDEVKVIVPHSQYKVVKENPEFFGDFKEDLFRSEQRVLPEALKSSPEEYLQVIRVSGARLISRYISDEPVNIIYSQWLGYLEEEGQRMYGVEELNKLREDPRVNFIYAHTSGHAVLEDLKRFAHALGPKMLIPIHTEYPGEFEQHFDNVIVLEDGQELVV
ncbi:MAG: MBL fold metallo-hydrolase [Planctomycetes bacterium]|nr:MBL fold metallo-hydrolase [Actinomycetota bacterium]MBU4274069.1 MBL fold metallo-hydrolase [Planctomycetota bacterium]